jgi:hypothetical protein
VASNNFKGLLRPPTSRVFYVRVSSVIGVAMLLGSPRGYAAVALAQG